jgi:putative transposase
MASLLIEVLLHYRSQNNYLLTDFVVMPNHLHLLITPRAPTLEKCMQLIKGGFSFRAKKELGFPWSIWQGSFHDRRIRDVAELAIYRGYIQSKPGFREIMRQG